MTKEAAGSEERDAMSHSAVKETTFPSAPFRFKQETAIDLIEME